jgi:hypothetical protein
MSAAIQVTFDSRCVGLLPSTGTFAVSQRSQCATNEYIIQITTRAARTSIQLEIWVPAIDVFRLNHSMAFLQGRPPHLGGLPRFQHPNDITDSQKPLGYLCGQ